MTTTEIITMILIHEGGIYTDDPADAGGPTKWGITMPTLAAYRRVPVSQITARDIQNLTRADATAIYRHLFVQPFEMFPDSQFRTNVIDMGVNAGVPTAVRLLQKTVGATVDGIIGRQTVQLAASRNWNAAFVGVRLLHYENLIERRPLNIKWRNGWRNRALAFTSPAMLMAGPRPMTAAEGAGHPRYGFTGKAYDIAA